MWIWSSARYSWNNECDGVAPWWYHMDSYTTGEILQDTRNARAYTTIVGQDLAVRVWNFGLGRS
jgi:hypothetical protein